MDEHLRPGTKYSHEKWTGLIYHEKPGVPVSHFSPMHFLCTAESTFHDSANCRQILRGVFEYKILYLLLAQKSDSHYCCLLACWSDTGSSVVCMEMEETFGCNLSDISIPTAHCRGCFFSYSCNQLFLYLQKVQKWVEVSSTRESHSKRSPYSVSSTKALCKVAILE